MDTKKPGGQNMKGSLVLPKWHDGLGGLGGGRSWTFGQTLGVRFVFK